MNSSLLKVSVIGAGSHVFGSSLLHEALVELKLDAVEFHLVDRILITGEAGHPVDHVSLRGIQFHMRDTFDPHPAGLTSWGDQFSPSTPEARAARAAVVLQHVNGVNLSDVVITGLPSGFETIWSLDCENIESTSVFCRP